MLKKLPINTNPSISSYVQHAYPLSIIECKELISLYMSNIDKYTWQISEGDVKYIVTSNKLDLFEDIQNRNNTNFYMWRKCNLSDEIIVKIDYIKRIDNLAYIEISVKYHEKSSNENIYKYKWNQYDIHINNKQYCYNTQKYVYHKIIRKNSKILSYISQNGKEWIFLDEFIIPIDRKEETYDLFIDIFFGENQYIKWKNMNFIQLFYNESDNNGVWLDYFIFPRKGFDASYHCFCNFLNTVYENLNEYLEGFSLLDYVKWNISNNYYINICIDEFYLPNRWATSYQHYGHYNLFYGFDDDKNCFYILGYDINGKLSVTELSYNDLLIDRVKLNEIVKYRFVTNKYPIMFNLDYFISTIKEYIQGINSSIHTANLLTQEKSIYGLKIFDAFANTEGGKTLLINDKRISFLLYEHCKMMCEKVRYLYKNNYISSDAYDKIDKLCIKMINSSETLKNMVIKSIISNNINIKDRIISQLKILNNNEIELYNNLLYELTT